MSAIAQVAIHPSQFPENVRRDLLESLRTRRVNPKFHYDSLKQTQKWLALHAAYAPSRKDPDCEAIYDAGFEAVSQHVNGDSVRLIGLGCGGGQKDTRLLRLLQAPGRRVSYVPVDVSVAMTLAARDAALAVAGAENIDPLVCDLATAEDLPAMLNERSTSAGNRIITFFGMIPNFEPQVIVPKLAALLRPNDRLLFSANLAPGSDYAAGVKRVLPQYDNEATREWLMTFLLDLGVERGDGKINFAIEETSDVSRLMRITASFQFQRDRRINVSGEDFDFHADESIRLFYSFRHTPALARELLQKHRISVSDEWITKSGEEGVFLCHAKVQPAKTPPSHRAPP